MFAPKPLYSRLCKGSAIRGNVFLAFFSPTSDICVNGFLGHSFTIVSDPEIVVSVVKTRIDFERFPKGLDRLVVVSGPVEHAADIGVDADGKRIEFTGFFYRGNCVIGARRDVAQVKSVSLKGL